MHSYEVMSFAKAQYGVNKYAMYGYFAFILFASILVSMINPEITVNYINS